MPHAAPPPLATTPLETATQAGASHAGKGRGRRKPLLTTALLMTALLTAAGAHAAETPVLTPGIEAAIAHAVAHARQVYGTGGTVPGVLVGVWDGKGGHYIHGFGTADLATGAPFTPADHVRIGSNTKTFVISVLLQLVDAGKLSLDDTLSRFKIGVTVPNADHITIRELCQMRSGLFEAYDVPQLQGPEPAAGSVWDPRRLIRWAVAQKPYFAPGTAYRYSNTNYLLLGLVIEAVTGHSVQSEIETRLLRPFHLDHTTYPTTMAMPTPWAHGYAAAKRGQWQDVSNTVPVSLMGAAGNMISDLGDMRRWVDLYVDGKTNAAATQKARLDCVPIGLGTACGGGWYGYTGGLPGYNTAAWRYPAGKLTVLVFVNLQASDPPPGVANAILFDIARILTPNHAPDAGASKGSGL